jgi:hypothetical protein
MGEDERARKTLAICIARVHRLGYVTRSFPHPNPVVKTNLLTGWLIWTGFFSNKTPNRPLSIKTTGKWPSRPLRRPVQPSARAMDPPRQGPSDSPSQLQC